MAVEPSNRVMSLIQHSGHLTALAASGTCAHAQAWKQSGWSPCLHKLVPICVCVCAHAQSGWSPCSHKLVAVCVCVCELSRHSVLTWCSSLTHRTRQPVCVCVCVLDCLSAESHSMRVFQIKQMTKLMSLNAVSARQRSK